MLSGEGNHTLKGWMDTWTHECVNAIMHSHMSELMDVCVHLKLINKEMGVSVGMNWLEEGGKLGTSAIDSINNFISSQNRCSSMLCPSTKRCQTGFTRKGYRCVCANGLLGENCTEGMSRNEELFKVPGGQWRCEGDSFTAWSCMRSWMAFVVLNCWDGLVILTEDLSWPLPHSDRLVIGLT